MLDGLYRALRRRDVYALGSIRWGDPRANLLDGPAWEPARPQVLTALRLTDPVTAHLSDLAGRLDAAYLGLAARLGPAGERDRDLPARLEVDRSGKIRLHLSPLESMMTEIGKLRAVRALDLPLRLFIDVAPRVPAGWRTRAAVEAPSHLRRHAPPR